MNIRKRLLATAMLVETIVSVCLAQSAAPAGLPPCIIRYTSQTALTQTSASRTVLYRSDGSYAELVVRSSGPLAGGTVAPHTGSFKYSADPQNPAHGLIVYDGGQGAVANDDLYFSSATGGTLTPPVSGAATPGSTLSEFTMYPMQGVSGGANFSNRCTLSTQTTNTIGFTVAGNSPRWILLRAVGSSLRTFGVSGTSSAPSFTLYDSSQAEIAKSMVWRADPNLIGGYKLAFSMVGAFPLSDGTDDGVLLLPLPPGVYTAAFNVGGAGEVLCEAYVLPF